MLRSPCRKAALILRGLLLAVPPLIGCSDPPAPSVTEPPEPPDVVIIGAAVTRTGADSVQVTALLRNLGRSGSAKVQAWGFHTSRDSADVLLGESSVVEIRSNGSTEVPWLGRANTSRSASGVRYLTALTRDASGAFRQTSRRNLD
jgi:hypothetical protein